MTIKSLRRISVLLAALILPILFLLVHFQIANSYESYGQDGDWPTDPTPSQPADAPYTPTVTSMSDDSVLLATSQHDCNTVSNPLVNCGFETGDFTGWITSDLTMPLYPLQVGGAGFSTGFGFFLSQPTEGSWAALHGFDGDGPGVIQIAQDVNLPGGTTDLLFDYRGGWDLLTFGATQDRLFQVSIGPFGGGVPTQTTTILTATVGTTVSDTGQLTGNVDLSAFAGTAVRISFNWVVPEDYTGPAFFQLDNVWVGPDLSVIKSSQPAGTIEVGDPMTYTIDVSAINSDFTGVIVTDTLPSEVILNQANPSQGTCSGTSIVVCDIGTLAAGNTVSITLAVTTTTPGDVSNVATVTGNEPEDNLANNTFTETRRIVPLIPQPGLYGSTVDGEIIYIDVETGAAELMGTVPFSVTEIEYDNASNRAFVQLSDGAFVGNEIDIRDGQLIAGIIPNGGAYNGIEYVGATAYGTAIYGPGGPSELRTLDPFSGISALVGPTGVGPITGLAYDEGSGTIYGTGGGGITTTNFFTLDLTTGAATVVGSTGNRLGGLQFGPDGKLYAGTGGTVEPGNLYEIDTATGSATLVGPTGFGKISGLTLVVGTDLSLDKSAAPEPAVVGQDLAYTLVISNNGPMTATNVMMTDTLPASVDYVSASASQGSCGHAGSVVTCSLGAIGDGFQAMVEIVVQPTTEGDIENTAIVTADEPDYLPNNNAASTVSTVERRIYLPITIKS